MSSFVPLSRSQLAFIAEEFWPGGGEDGDGRDLYGVAKRHGVWREETSDADLIAEALHPADADYYDREGVADMDDEEFEAWLAEDDADEEDNNYLDVLDAQWLAGLRAARDADDGLDGEDGPDTLELARTAEITLTRQIAIDPWCVVVPQRWNASEILNGERDGSELEDVGTEQCGPGVANKLERFARDGITKVGMRFGVGSFGQHRDTRREHHPNIGPSWLADPATGRYRPNPSWNGRQRFDSWKRHREAQYRARHIDPKILDRAERRRNANGTLWYLDPAVLYPRAA